VLYKLVGMSMAHTAGACRFWVTGAKGLLSKQLTAGYECGMAGSGLRNLLFFFFLNFFLWVWYGVAENWGMHERLHNCLPTALFASQYYSALHTLFMGCHDKSLLQVD